MCEAPCDVGPSWVPPGAEGGDSSASECFSAAFVIQTEKLKIKKSRNALTKRGLTKPYGMLNIYCACKNRRRARLQDKR